MEDLRHQVPEILLRLDETAGSAGGERSRPAAHPEQTADRDRQPTGLEHLAPPDAHRDVAEQQRREVTVEVGPPVSGTLVPEPTVELDDNPEADVLDVPE